MQQPFPALDGLRVLLTAALFWLHFGGVATPFLPHPGQLRVLIVEETSDRGGLTPDQRDVIESTAPGSVRDYCATHCAKGEGGNLDFRVIDKDDDVSRDEQWVKEAFAITRPSVPWIYISAGGAGGWSGPVDGKTKDVLRKWGGP